MLHVVLYEPEIPPNTGNVIRLCANTNATLHLIEPLGFKLDAKKLVRAGLDYHEWVNTKVYPNFQTFLDQNRHLNLYAVSTKGKTLYHEAAYHDNDAFLFGPETRGLPADLLQAFPKTALLRVPMANQTRSLNLANTVAIILYEALRQLKFSF